jgi:hypothetical protein
MEEADRCDRLLLMREGRLTACAGAPGTCHNAQIDGDRIRVTAPVSSTLVGWRAAEGSILRKDQPIGRIRIPGAFAEPEKIIRAPADCTVARDNGGDGTSCAGPDRHPGSHSGPDAGAGDQCLGADPARLIAAAAPAAPGSSVPGQRGRPPVVRPGQLGRQSVRIGEKGDDMDIGHGQQNSTDD